MKATEFVKKYGWDEAIRYSKMIGLSNVCGCSIDDLKRLVESRELVESCGGVDAVKQYLMDGNVFRFEEKPLMRKAIAEVEACQ